MCVWGEKADGQNALGILKKMELEDGERGNRIANRERERLDVHITS